MNTVRWGKLELRRLGRMTIGGLLGASLLTGCGAEKNKTSKQFVNPAEQAEAERHVEQAGNAATAALAAQTEILRSLDEGQFTEEEAQKILDLLRQLESGERVEDSEEVGEGRSAEEPGLVEMDPDVQDPPEATSPEQPVEESPAPDEPSPDEPLPLPPQHVNGGRFENAGYLCEAGSPTPHMNLENELLTTGRNLTLKVGKKNLNVHVKRTFQWSFEGKEALRQQVWTINDGVTITTERAYSFMQTSGYLVLKHQHNLFADEWSGEGVDDTFKEALVVGLHESVRQAAQTQKERLLLRLLRLLASADVRAHLLDLGRDALIALTQPREVGELTWSEGSFTYSDTRFDFSSSRPVVNLLLMLLPQSITQDAYHKAYCGEGGRVARRFQRLSQDL